MDVDVGGKNPVADSAQRTSVVQVVERDSAVDQLVQAVEDVIARDGSDPQPLGLLRPGNFDQRAAAGRRVDSPGIGHDANALCTDLGQHTADQLDEIGGVALVRVASSQLLHDRHRHLGQVVQRQVVQRTFLDQTHRRIDRVAPETLAVGHTHDGLNRH